jgi:hypothetical protein
MVNDIKKQQARLSILEKLKQKGFQDLSPFPGKEEEPELPEEDQALPMGKEAEENPGEESNSLSLDMVLQPKFLGKKKRLPEGSK